MSPDGTGSPAGSKLILAAVSKSVGILPSGEGADGAGSHIDTRDNQLDELNRQVLSGGSMGAAPNSPDSLSGAVVQTPNSVSCVEGAVPNSNSALNNVNSKETSDIDNEDINDNAYETSSEGLLLLLLLLLLLYHILDKGESILCHPTISLAVSQRNQEKEKSSQYI